MIKQTREQIVVRANARASGVSLSPDKTSTKNIFVSVVKLIDVPRCAYLRRKLFVNLVYSVVVVKYLATFSTVARC